MSAQFGVSVRRSTSSSSSSAATAAAVDKTGRARARHRRDAARRERSSAALSPRRPNSEVQRSFECLTQARRGREERESLQFRQQKSGGSESESASRPRLSGALGLHLTSELTMRKARARQRKRDGARAEESAQRCHRRGVVAYLPTHSNDRDGTTPYATGRRERGRRAETRSGATAEVEGERHEQGVRPTLLSYRHNDQRTDRPTDRPTD